MAAIDYSSFRDPNDPSKTVRQDDASKPVVQWWKAEPGPELANAVFGQLNTLVQADRGRINSYNINSRLYGNQGSPISGLGNVKQLNNNQGVSPRERIAFNVMQSCADTLTSKIAKNKPKPYFLTSKGDSKIQRKAKKLNAFCDGVFYENNAYAMMPRMFLDGLVFGEGIIHPYADHGRVKWERVLPHTMFVDYLETIDGADSAKTLHRVKMMDRTTLMALLPDEEAVISQLPSANDLASGSAQSVSDTVAVCESWRLPSAPDAEDGMHCICAPGIKLFSEKYTRTFFPFAIFRYAPRLYGFWSQSLCEQLTPIQVELNRCLMTVQRSFHLGGSFKVLLHATSKVIKSHLDNTVGSIIQWAGDHPPQYIIPPMVQPEIYQQIATLKQMAYEQSGISQLSAASQKPAGLNSGKALRETVDIETDRFQTVGQAYEGSALDLAKISIAVACDIYRDEGKMAVRVPGKKFIETIDWGDVDLDEDEYVMQAYPVSKLPSTPEGRLETIQEMMQAGLIDPETGRRLLDFPDLDEDENLANAVLDYYHKVLDAMVEDGEYELPDPHFSTITGLKLAFEYYAVGKRDNLEEEKLELLRRYIIQLNQLQQAAAPPPPAPTPVAPQANPEPTPTSNIVPNVNGAAA